ncbi:hypothetical protein FPOAC2_03839 [Fusarium poae]|uniref:hypothetical protein n=1 Tax=Fusarium poae TaxID=36050 RepID=UPI001CE804F5|nr:hypothetical protein FPOAC1_003761 [Fusarium poae]KAG8677733.1 hypothetical protein FPOAC1_003761 [Fusarium poae]
MAPTTRDTVATGQKRRIEVDLTEAPVNNKRGRDATTRDAATRDDYTIGWICALPKELTAAIAMLDQQHPTLPIPSEDNNAYTLGCIGEHNIVIAYLPKGITGNVAIATMASHMANSFPSIKLVLMVGIGSGIPSNKVRLGDVVVGTSIGMHPGVVKWQTGKVDGEDNFERTGALNNPPHAVLTALTRLEAQQNLAGTKIPSYLEELKQKWPNIASTFLRHDSLKDLLFKSTYNHVVDCITDSADEKDEDEDDEHQGCRLCDRTMTVKRKPRDMLVHYGLIASGDTLITDATSRNKLNKDLGGKVLCLEKEASGLKNNFPCLVVRGICDYADSHKNKDWQEHGCIVAAAFAKELLQYVHASDVAKERSVKDVHQTVTEASSGQKQDTATSDLDWIVKADYKTDQSRSLSLRQPGTGQWFLDTTEFQNWVSAPEQTLLCLGIPGAGKTILTSIVIDYLKSKIQNDRSIGLAYFYCNSNRYDKQTLYHVIASLFRQLAENISYSKKRAVSEHSRVYVVIDGLNEYGETESSRESFLKLLAQLQHQNQISVFLTSRFDYGIRSEVGRAFDNTAETEIGAARDDIERFVEAKMNTLSLAVRDNTDLQKDIKEGITNCVDGMFLLAPVFFNLLVQQNSETEIRDQLKAFTYIDCRGQDGQVRALTKAFKQTMDRIEQQEPEQVSLAKQVIAWLAYAKRELTVTELQHALATSSLRRHVCESDLPSDATLGAACAGLVIIDEARKTIGLVHQTAQEYFRNNNETLVPMTEQDVARTCIAYLTFNEVKGKYFDHSKFEEALKPCPLYHYAANNWWRHALESCISGDELMTSINSNPTFMTSVDTLFITDYSRRKGYDTIGLLPSSFSALHLAAYCGLEDLVRRLLQTGHEVDPIDSSKRTPLSYAAKRGHQGTTQILLDSKADPNRSSTNRRSEPRTPVSFAAKYGHESVVRLLIAKGASVTNFDLLRAARGGHEPVVRLLTEKGLCVNYKHQPLPGFSASFHTKYDGKTAISLAAQKGHEAVVQYLLQNGADLGHEGLLEITPLSFAASSGNLTVVKLILDAATHLLNLVDIGAQTPLCYAARYGHNTVVRLLLEHGADKDINFENIEAEVNDGTRSAYECNMGGRSPLSYAAENGHTSVVKMLLAQGADPESQSSEINYWHYGRTPLSFAALHGHEAVVKLLLDENVCLDTPAKSVPYMGGTALSSAATNGHDSIVALLLQAGSNPEPPQAIGNTDAAPFSLAASGGHAAVEKMLLDVGVTQIDMPDSEGRTPLSHMAQNGHDENIRLLLQKGVNVNYHGTEEDDLTPLSFAAASGHASIVQLLLAHGANPDDRCTTGGRIIGMGTLIFSGGMTPLSFAVSNGHELVVRILLEQDNVNPDDRDDDNRTLLARAIENGHEAIVRLLLEKGADLEATFCINDWKPEGTDETDVTDVTPLMAAAVYDRLEITGILIYRGARLDCQDSSNYTALCCAVQNNSIGIVLLLLNSGAAIKPKHGGPTPLSLTTDTEMAELLIRYGDDVNFKDSRGRTPLSNAVKNENLCHLLIKNGADVDTQDHEGRTPLLIACLEGEERVATLLASRGANVNSKDHRGRTPLIEAAHSGMEDVVRLLLRKGADLNAKDDDGNTALSEGNEYPGVMNVLSEGSGQNAEVRVTGRSRRH